MSGSKSYPIVVAITGASGAIYAVRLLQYLIAAQTHSIHLTISPSGAAVLKQELGLDVSLSKPDLIELVGLESEWMKSAAGQPTKIDSLPAQAALACESMVHYHHYQDFMTPIASGSFRTSAMVICPCSGSTLSGIARSASSNLIQRAAEVHLKEHRKLILVPRETPLSVFQLENMHRLAAAGTVILPAMPGWYHGVDSLRSLVDFVVSRILDQLDLDNDAIERWKE
jgi:flavin prenyltransferase